MAGADEVVIRLGGAAEVPRVKPLWEALYVQQRQQGMLLPVPEDGFAHWARTLEPVLGRFGCLALAERGPELIGFVAGRTRALPAHFGGGMAGLISDVFVVPEQRGRGLAKRMLGAAGDWFASQKIQRLELQVIMGNGPARDAYLKLGWKEELIQMVFELPVR